MGKKKNKKTKQKSNGGTSSDIGLVVKSLQANQPTVKEVMQTVTMNSVSNLESYAYTYAGRMISMSPYIELAGMEDDLLAGVGICYEHDGKSDLYIAKVIPNKPFSGKGNSRERRPFVQFVNSQQDSRFNGVVFMVPNTVFGKNFITAMQKESMIPCAMAVMNYTPSRIESMIYRQR